MKEVRFSDHALLKLDVLAARNIVISRDFAIQVVLNPDKIEPASDGKRIAQKRLDEKLVLRVVYREFNAFIFVITVYPGGRSRYEKS